jgi:hypothetical protein
MTLKLFVDLLMLIGIIIVGFAPTKKQIDFGIVITYIGAILFLINWILSFFLP